MMPEAANISILPNAELNIFIKHVNDTKPPFAAIITSSGETVKHIMLSLGNNNINITSYLYKNYAIRVVNGKNVTVQNI